MINFYLCALYHVTISISRDFFLTCTILGSTCAGYGYAGNGVFSGELGGI